MYIPGVDGGIALAAAAAQASPRGFLAMGDENNAGRARSLEAQRPKAGDEKPFDAWLRKQLHAMYDEIAAEPLPSDLIELIDRDTTAGAGERPSQIPEIGRPGPAIKKDKS
jgi:hypothetical protein